MRKFVKIQSIDAEEMDLGTALKNGLVTMAPGTKPEEYEESWPGYHTVMAKVVHMNGSVEREESWLPEEDFGTEWPREVVDDEFGWSSMAALSVSPGTKIYAEFHENQIRYQRALAAMSNTEPNMHMLGLDHQDSAVVAEWSKLLKKHAAELRDLCLSYVNIALMARVYLTIENELAEFVSKEDMEKIESYKAKIDRK